MYYCLKGFRNLLSVFSCLFISINLTLTNGGKAIFCQNSGNFTTDDPYDHNRNIVLSSLASYGTVRNGSFYLNSFGQAPYKVYALALCRGDSPSDESCVSCINATSQDIMTMCPHQKEAFMWGDTEPPCLVRYADHPVSGKLADRDLPFGHVEYGGNLTDLVKMNLTEFYQIWESFMVYLAIKASRGPFMFKYATEEVNLPISQKIYALMQCTPDLSVSDCDTCLRQSVEVFQDCCFMSGEGTVQRANCYLEWSIQPFYKPIINVPPSVSTTPSETNNAVNCCIGEHYITSRTIIIIVVAVATIIISIIFIGFLVFRAKKSSLEIECVKEIKNAEYLQFDLGTIKFATENFSDANKLGQGGYGVVYKGTLLSGQQIAVKRLSMNSMQGEEEFKNEVTLVAKLQHRNLVKLLGFCVEKKEQILVFEFLPNSSLDRFIFDPIKRENLDWERRYEIIGGIARGLLYLHEDSRIRIIHRDLKASNVLLDSKMNPKITDFGIARLFALDQTHSSTIEVVGTFGYMPPEYIIHKRFSTSTDVFSFGVLLLEIVSGQKRSCFGTEEETKCLLTYAWKRWNEGTALNLIDSTLREGSRTEMMKCIHIGLLCVQESVSDRPSMASVVHMLNSNSVTLPAPSEPGFFMHSPNILEISPSSSLSSLEHNFESKEQDQLNITLSHCHDMKLKSQSRNLDSI